ncbi:class I SAM-dependent methyltransferase [Streptomyces sp. NPDC048518]|uniref:class I SAM-dependent methyltransferase n=1 Tax=Streptomyces sp. NPDC048518 TaxID=3155029 RepID=UPI003400EF6C
MSQFDTTAPFYAAYRPGIPKEAVELLARRVAGKKCRALLDLGSGTGQVPLALAGEVTAIDVVEQDTDMLREAATALAGLPVTVHLHNASAEEFTPPAAYRANLVTICRAFHWMKQDVVLSRLEGMTAPDASVAVMGDGSLWTARTAWTDALRALIQEYLGEERRAGMSKKYAAHDRPYSEILAESAFGRVEEHTIAVQREWSTETVIGYLYSTSFAARPLFGERVQDFERRARVLLDGHAADGGLIERASFQVVLGRRG